MSAPASSSSPRSTTPSAPTRALAQHRAAPGLRRTRRHLRSRPAACLPARHSLRRAARRYRHTRPLRFRSPRRPRSRHPHLSLGCRRHGHQRYLRPRQHPRHRHRVLQLPARSIAPSRTERQHLPRQPHPRHHAYRRRVPQLRPSAPKLLAGGRPVDPILVPAPPRSAYNPKSPRLRPVPQPAQALSACRAEARRPRHRPRGSPAISTPKAAPPNTSPPSPRPSRQDVRRCSSRPSQSPLNQRTSQAREEAISPPHSRAAAAVRSPKEDPPKKAASPSKKPPPRRPRRRSEIEEAMKPLPSYPRRSPHRARRWPLRPDRPGRQRKPHPLRLPPRVARAPSLPPQQLVKPCSEFTFGHLTDIGQTLVTGQPLHIALGSLAPQNGFAPGLAFVEHKDFKNERRSPSTPTPSPAPTLSWRAGSYLTTYKLPQSNQTIGVVMGTPTAKQRTPTVQVAPVFNLYAEATSLNRLYFYGLGPNTLPAGQSAFGLTETIAGASAILPLNRDGISFTAEFNGRVPQLRPIRASPSLHRPRSTPKPQLPASPAPPPFSSPARHPDPAQPLQRTASACTTSPTSRTSPASAHSLQLPPLDRRHRSRVPLNRKVTSPPPTPTTAPTPAPPARHRLPAHLHHH
jgi:hypothetical protein